MRKWHRGWALLALTSTAAIAACSGEVAGGGDTAQDAGADAPTSMPTPTPPGRPDAPPPIDAAVPVPPHEAGPGAPDASDAQAQPDAPAKPDAEPPPDASSPIGQPPPPPQGPPTATTAEHQLAFQKVFFGDTDWMGTPSTSAWRAFGYNLDGKVTVSGSTDVCTLAPGAARSTQADGSNGIDNSWGANILPIILTTAGSGFSQTFDDGLASGTFGILLDTTGLDLGGAQTATGLSGFMNRGTAFDPSGQKKPTFTTADDWPVDPAYLANPSDPRSSTLTLTASYVVSGTFVSGAPATIVIPLSIGGTPLPLTIHHATLTFETSPGKATHGVIAGVLDTEEFVAALHVVAGHISTSLCSGQAFDSIAQQIRQASDILKDGTNAAGVACNGISIGLGFEAAEIGLPKTVGPASVPTPDPCGD